LTFRILGAPMLAEEATQDTFLKLWSRAHLYLAGRARFAVAMAVNDCPSQRA
jgi:DNA-directed RNA polymerase specialized sigma24 family protein